MEYIKDGVCDFCGQVILDGGNCDCPEAERQIKIENQIERAAISIQEIFGDKCKENDYEPVQQDNIDIMYDAATQIANHKMHAVSFVLSSGTRAKLTRGAKGVIKVERSETKKMALEVEE